MDHHRRTALIVLGGDDPDEVAALRRTVGADVVIAADSGIDLALRLGLTVDVAVGDFDSVSAEGLDRVREQGARVERHPVAKAHTDFELALDTAVQMSVAAVTVVGGEGGRIDHLLANAFVMASERYAAVELTAHGHGGSRILVVRSRRHIVGQTGELVSLLAVHGPALGVSTEHLRYPLHGDRLDPGSTRGVSNELTAAEAFVSVDSGVVLAVLPGPGHVTGTSSVADPTPDR